MALKRKAKTKQKEVSLIDLEQTPNSEIFMHEVKTLSSAAVGVIVVRTREFHRAATSLFEFAIAKGGTRVRTWMITDGWRTLPTESRAVAANSPIGGAWVGGVNDPGGAPGVPEYICDLYPPSNLAPPDGMMEINGAMAAFFDNVQADVDSQVRASVNIMFAPEYWFENPGFQEHIRHAVSQAMDTDARLFLLCHDSVEIPERLYEEVKIIDFDVPNANELYHAIDDILNNSEIDGEPGGELNFELSEQDKYRIVQNGLGLSAGEFATALSIGFVKQEEAIRNGDPVDVNMIVDTILDSKLEMIKKNPILEYKPPVPMSKVGGLDVLKDWIAKRKRAFSAEAAAFGVDKPKGLLAAGIPGSGKSLIAKAVSSVLGIPCLSLDIGKVFGGLVGQSEGQMRSTLKLVEAQAPCVLLVDEIDKGFSNVSGGGDSGTTARVFGTFLTWMQERKNSDKPVMVVFTANNVAHLPPELLRKGRVDEIFCVSFPSAEERKEIFKIHGSARGHEFSDEVLADVVRATREFVGAEIESIVQEAILTAFVEGKDAVTSEILVNTAAAVRPIAKTFPDKIKAMNSWARENAVAASKSYDFGDAGEDASRLIPKRSTGARVLRPDRSRRN